MLVCGNPERMADYDPCFEARRAQRALASMAMRRGDLDKGARLYGMILAENPDDPDPMP